MKKYRWVYTLPVALAVCCALSVQAAAKPNIVFILADDRTGSLDEALRR